MKQYEPASQWQCSLQPARDTAAVGSLALLYSLCMILYDPPATLLLLLLLLLLI